MSAMAYTPKFPEWLENEMEVRGISQAELARQAGVTRGAINGILKGVRGPGVDLCMGIAQAFKIPPEQVYRAAGILPSQPGVDSLTEEIIYIFGDLEKEDKEDVMRYARMRKQVAQDRAKYNVRKGKRRPSTPR